MGSRKVVLELLDALAEAWSAIEQESWSLSEGKLRKTGKAKSQQDESDRASCLTRRWTENQHV
jgi:hypothetical protein